MDSNNILSGASSVSNKGDVKLKDDNVVNIQKYSSLDERMQKVALEAIHRINETISTDGKHTWNENGYTNSICERIEQCINARNTLFVAIDKENVIGYVAFYTKLDKIPYPSRFLESDNEAYCSWTGVDEAYRGKGLAEALKLQIFEPEHNIYRFKGHIKKTNEASIRVLDKFTEKGYETTKEPQGHQWYYSVNKKPTSSQ